MARKNCFTRKSENFRQSGRLTEQAVKLALNFKVKKRMSQKDLFVVLVYKNVQYKWQIGPFETLAEVLNKFASEHGLDPELFALRHERLGILNLSQGFSLLGLESNVVLEVIEVAPLNSPSSSVVKFGLLVDGNRLDAAVSARSSLWEAIEAVATSSGLNLTGQTNEQGVCGRVLHKRVAQCSQLSGELQAPVLVWTDSRRSFAGLDVLARSTLQSIGASVHACSFAVHAVGCCFYQA